VCVFDKPRRKKKTRKTKVKMAGLCEGWPENIGNEEMEEKGGRSWIIGYHFKGGHG
jgi:hypothetical protein